MVDKEIEENFQKFWADIIILPDGSVNLEQVKRELFDYSMVMREASKVYEELTGGRISKTNTFASEVLSIVNERTEEMIREAIIEELETQ